MQLPLYVPENTLCQPLDCFKETRQHIVLVVDEFGGTEVSAAQRPGRGDRWRRGGRDESSTEIVAPCDGSYLVDVRVPLEELAHVCWSERRFDPESLGFSDTDIQTVAALVLALGACAADREIAEGSSWLAVRGGRYGPSADRQGAGVGGAGAARATHGRGGAPELIAACK